MKRSCIHMWSSFCVYYKLQINLLFSSFAVKSVRICSLAVVHNFRFGLVESAIMLRCIDLLCHLLGFFCTYGSPTSLRALINCNSWDSFREVVARLHVFAEMVDMDFCDWSSGLLSFAS